MSEEPTPAPAELRPLNVQAAALVRSIDALSNIFWISIAGTILTVLFAGLNQLESNIAADSIFIGEYEIPKSILPIASLSFALFVFWLTANRLRMLEHVLTEGHLPERTALEIFNLNPPVLNLFHAENRQPFALGTGSSVLLINWSIFFGNSIAFTLASAIQQGASFSTFDSPRLAVFAILTIAVLTYGARAITRPLNDILTRLHQSAFKLGWARVVIAITIMVGVVVINNIEQIVQPSEQPNDLLGPARANAIDGETIFMLGVEVQLFGIDAMESDQLCRDATGADYPCGRQATAHLQALVNAHPVVCLPILSISRRRILASCDSQPPGSPDIVDGAAFFAAEHPLNLSRQMVQAGYAFAVGAGETLFAQAQDLAQRERRGVWAGSFEPPWRYRARRD